MLLLLVLSTQGFLRPFPLPEEVPALSWEVSKPEVFRRLSLPVHLPSLVDSFWIRGLQQADLSRTAPKEGERDPLFWTFQMITALDPPYFQAYEAGSILLAFIRRDFVGAAKLAEDGIRFFEGPLAEVDPKIQSRDWNQGVFLYLQLGYLQLFRLNRADLAAETFKKAAAVPNAPEHIQKMAERISSPDGPYLLGLRLLEGLLFQVPPRSEAHESLLAQKHSLEVGRFVFNLNLRASTEAWHLPSGARDPWGGTLTQDSNTLEIFTTTPYEKVYGLGKRN